MMRALSADRVLCAWEDGRAQNPVERALTVLGAAMSSRAPEELAALPLGERDRELLLVRVASFGWTLRSAAKCAACGERVEFELDAAALLSQPRAESSELALSVDDFALRARLPDSLDLAAIAGRDE